MAFCFFLFLLWKKLRYNLDPGPETKICIIFISVSATTEHEPPSAKSIRRLDHYFAFDSDFLEEKELIFWRPAQFFYREIFASKKIKRERAADDFVPTVWFSTFRVDAMSTFDRESNYFIIIEQLRRYSGTGNLWIPVNFFLKFILFEIFESCPLSSRNDAALQTMRSERLGDNEKAESLRKKNFRCAQ